MLDLLREAEDYLQSTQALNEVREWRSLYINYGVPVVSRLWRPWRDKYRIHLHQIEAAPEWVSGVEMVNPWPFATKILQGGYRQTIATAAGCMESELVAGCSFYVDSPVPYWIKPRGLTYSIAVTGEPFPKRPEKPAKGSLTPLEDPVVRMHLIHFEMLLNGELEDVRPIQF